MILFPQLCIQGVTKGMTLCFSSLIPAILPFMLICNFMTQLGIAECISPLVHPLFKLIFNTSVYGSYCVFMGLLCGYPMGAKITNDLLDQHKLSPKEANHVLVIANHSSLGYIQNYLIVTMLKPSGSLLPYLSFYYVPIVLYGFFSGRFRDYKKITTPPHNSISGLMTSPSRKLLDFCILDALKTMSKLCGYVIIFSILSEFISNIPCIPVEMKACLLMLTELTNGTAYVMHSSCPRILQLILCYTGTILGGASILLQTKSVCTNPQLSIRRYIRNRIIMVLISILYLSLYDTLKLI